MLPIAPPASGVSMIADTLAKPQMNADDWWERQDKRSKTNEEFVSLGRNKPAPRRAVPTETLRWVTPQAAGSFGLLTAACFKGRSGGFVNCEARRSKASNSRSVGPGLPLGLADFNMCNLSANPDCGRRSVSVQRRLVPQGLSVKKIHTEDRATGEDEGSH